MAKKKSEATPPVSAPVATATVAPVAVSPEPRKRRAPVVESKPAPEAQDDFDPLTLESTAAPEQPAAADSAPAGSSSPAETPPPAETPSAPVVHKHSRRALAEANDWQIPLDQAERMSSDELDWLIYERKRQYREWQQKREQESRESLEKANIPAPEPEPELSEKDYEGWSAEVVEVMKKRDAVTKAALEKAKKADALEKRLAEIEKREQDRAAAAETERLDRAFSKHAAVFGDGSITDLADDSVQAQRRHATLALLLARAKAGEKFNVEAEIAKSARLFGPVAETEPQPSPKPAPPAAPADEDEAEEDADAKAVKERAEKWAEEGPVAKPTARTALELPPGEERALKHIKERMKAGSAGPLHGAEKKAELDDIFG